MSKAPRFGTNFLHSLKHDFSLRLPKIDAPKHPIKKDIVMKHYYKVWT